VQNYWSELASPGVLVLTLFGNLLPYIGLYFTLIQIIVKKTTCWEKKKEKTKEKHNSID
jgi:hypothetical protein